MSNPQFTRNALLQQGVVEGWSVLRGGRGRDGFPSGQVGSKTCPGAPEKTVQEHSDCFPTRLRLGYDGSVHVCSRLLAPLHQILLEQPIHYGHDRRVSQPSVRYKVVLNLADGGLPRRHRDFMIASSSGVSISALRHLADVLQNFDHFAGFYLTGCSIGQRSDLELQLSVRQIERDNVVDAELVTCPGEATVDLDAAGIAGGFCHRPPGDDAAPLQKQVQSHLSRKREGVTSSGWSRPHPNRCNLHESR